MGLLAETADDDFPQLVLYISSLRQWWVIICSKIVSYQLSVKARWVRGVLSHPFARKKAKGWGTGHWWMDESGTSNVRAIPGLKIQTWGTQHWD
jgi:hypothetical protein